MRYEAGAADALLERTADEREHVRELVQSRRWREAEPNSERLANYLARHQAVDAPAGAEAIQGGISELQAIRFLTLGARARRAVAFVEVMTPTTSTAGSGFLVSPRVFLTNAHVIPDAAAAAGATVTFDRELDEDGRPRAHTSYRLDPDTLAVFSAEDDLDFALVAVGERLTGPASLDEFGFAPLSDRSDKHAIGMPVNIIQHPRQWLKMIACRNNFLSYRTETTLLYETDTDEGSSGSPVFNDDWEVVALHHWGQPHRALLDGGDQTVPTAVNEGIRISAIYRHLGDVRAGVSAAGAGALLDEILAATDRKGPAAGERPLGPPRLSSTRPATTTTNHGEAATVTQQDGPEARLVIPLEVTIRVGGGVAAAAPVATPAPAVAAAVAPVGELRPLTRGPEAVKIDLDYTNRSGYDPDFIPGVTVPLPEIDAAAGIEVAPLRDGDTAGLLTYEHFSLKLDVRTRLAAFTATNVDGPTYLKVDRDTGKVTASEGERWFNDSRISPNYHLDQTFYSAWSHVFDRGHLTRRTDPTWGTPAVAERANADTFHFANCSPQHWRFNQSADYWQGLERYVLEKGVLAPGSAGRICVLQGPVFDENDRWADDVRIPSAFWKVVVWQGASKLKAVGLVAHQEDLLDEFRKNIARPSDDRPIDVRQFRTAIEVIEKRTGLRFTADIVAADTIKESGQPAVGAESVHPIGTWSDIDLGALPM